MVALFIVILQDMFFILKFYIMCLCIIKRQIYISFIPIMFRKRAVHLLIFVIEYFYANWNNISKCGMGDMQ